MASDPVAICNRALDEIGTQAIQSLNDNTPTSKVCARQYQAALEEMLAEGEWGFAKRRAILVETTNDRTDDGFAFSLPNDMALPLRMVPNYPGLQYPEVDWTPILNLQTFPYDLGDGKLYARYDGVILEYVTNSPNPALFPPLFARALVLILAAKIVYPIQKDAQRRSQLLSEAEVYRTRALANEQNRVPASYGNFVPEVMSLIDSDGIVSSNVFGVLDRPTGNTGY